MAEPGEARIALQPIIVTIKHLPGNAPTCDRDPVALSKKNHNEIAWVCVPPQNFTVIMQSPSPFQGSVFTQDNNQSGEPILTPDPNTQLQFKYTVIVGQDHADPGVIINP